MWLKLVSIFGYCQALFEVIFLITCAYGQSFLHEFGDLKLLANLRSQIAFINFDCYLISQFKWFIDNHSQLESKHSLNYPDLGTLPLVEVFLGLPTSG